MPIWDALQSGDPDPQAGGSEIVPESLAADPILGPLMSDPAIMEALMGTPQTAATTQQSLTDMLVDSAHQVTGRKGITGRDLQNPLPPWAKDLAPEILKHPDYDPYFGVVSQQGDERIYMGTRETRTAVIETPTDPEDGPRGGMGRLADEAPASGSPVHQTVTKRAADEPTGEVTKKTVKKGGGDKTLTAMQALNLPYTWDEEEIADAMKRMRQAGLPVDSFDMGSNSLVSVWGALVERAGMTYAMSEGARKVTPWDVLDMYKSEAKAAGTFQNYQNGTQTTVQRSVTDVGEGEAWAMLQQNLSRMLGRDPSDQELRDFTFRMNQLAAANPAVSKTITRYKNGEAVSSDTTTKSGFSSADMAQEAYEGAQSDPEYAEYQSATTYFNAAMSALGAIGQT